MDLEWLQRELFSQVPKQDGRLVLAITHNTAYYAMGDATVCCSWGTHGVDSGTGNSFVLASYLGAAPAVVTDSDVQPITQQLAQFIKDPLHDPLVRGGRDAGARQRRPVVDPPRRTGGCGGTGVGSHYFLLEPTNTNPKNNFPASKPFVAEAAAELPPSERRAASLVHGRRSRSRQSYSFPDSTALPAPAKPCAGRGGRGLPAAQRPTVAASAGRGCQRAQLIGYWAGYGSAQSIFPLREVSPQWDVILVAFATPDRNAPEGTMQFRTPAGLDTAQFKADIAWLKSQGKKVMISLGGGGQHFTLADPKRVPNFVASVTQIVSDYGFDGIDIDFESPSLSIEPGDTDYRHPDHAVDRQPDLGAAAVARPFRAEFMISLVPEGTQIPAGYPELRRPVRVLPADRARASGHPLFHGCAGLQHAAAAGAGWRDLPARDGRLSRSDDRTPAARLQRWGRSEAVLPADAGGEGRGRLSDGRHYAGDCEPGDGLPHYGQGPRGDDVQATQPLRLSWR